MLSLMCRPNSSSYRTLSFSSVYKHHEDIKKCEHGHQFREVEHGVLCLLLLVIGSGGNYFL